MICDLPRNLLAVLALVGLMAFGTSATAGLIETETLAQELNVQAERDAIQAEVSRPEAVKKLEAMGVDPAKAAERVGAMTDAEVREIALKMDAMPAAGRLSDTALVLLLILLVVLLI